MKEIINHPFKPVILFVALLFLFFVAMESTSFARAGGGRSSGSRGFSSGSGSYQRSAPSQPSQQPGMTQRPPVQQQPAAPSFGRSMLYGIGGGLLGGMLGSMLFGGHGFAGGPGWGGGGFGFSDIIIILVILGIVYFVIKRFRARRQMEMSAAGPGYGSYAYNEPAPEPAYEPASQEDGVSAGLRHIASMDPSFNETRFKETVEDNFFRIQSAWTKRDLSNVRHLLTPQMLNTFQGNINQYIADKKVNRLENIAVRQVDIVDAAQDQGEEYITVKFLASLLDYTVDDTAGQTISGSSTEPVKFLEYWTFTRKTGGREWMLAGITQEGDY
jgi:predicted lipid-binding transport protein (Tim44 family)